MSPGRDERRPSPGTPPAQASDPTKDLSSTSVSSYAAGLGQVVMHAFDADHFRARVLQDCLTEATASYWRRRAVAFEAARPRPGDFNGRVTPDELAARDERCRLAAELCRHRAGLSLEAKPEPITPDVWAVLDEVAA